MYRLNISIFFVTGVILFLWQSCGVTSEHVEKPRVLLTGFEPFDHKTDNPSGDIAKRLNGSCTTDVCFDTLLLPVSSIGSATVAKLLNNSGNKWDAVLHLGEDIPAMFMKVTKAHIEVVAANLKTSDQGDIVKGAQSILPTTVDISNSRLQSIIDANDTRIKWSRDAGKYYCNEAYYQTLFFIRDNNIPPVSRNAGNDGLLLPALFVHVPPLKVMTVDEGTSIATAVATAMVVTPATATKSNALPRMLLAGFADRLGPDRGGAAAVHLNGTCNTQVCFDTIIVDFSNGGGNQDIASAFRAGKWDSALIVAEQENRMVQGLTLQAVGYKTDDMGNDAVLPSTLRFDRFNPALMPLFDKDDAALAWCRDSGIGNAGKSFFNLLVAIHNNSLLITANHNAPLALLATLPEDDNRSTAADAVLVKTLASLMLS